MTTQGGTGGQIDMTVGIKDWQLLQSFPILGLWDVESQKSFHRSDVIN